MLFSYDRSEFITMITSLNILFGHPTVKDDDLSLAAGDALRNTSKTTAANNVTPPSGKAI